MRSEGGAPLLAVEDLRVELEAELGRVRAVNGVSFSVGRGRTLGIVGESGAGKTVTVLALLGLLDRPGANVSGRALLEGTDLTALTAAEMRSIRGDRAAIVFQDPLSALHPLHRIGSQIVEAIRVHQPIGETAARRRAIELLELVRMPDAGRRFGEYAHELSGGMRQRAMLAIALANDPELLIADEPTSALDVTTQAQILGLIGRLQVELRMTVLLISHDLGVVAELADDVVVMRAGRVVERGSTERLLAHPQQPYTQRLLDAVPSVDRPSPPRAGRAGAATLLEVTDLAKLFPTRRRWLTGRGGEGVRAVAGVGFSIAEGETLGLVGESGCGKSTLCRVVVRLLEPDAGSIRFRGREIARSSQRELRGLRSEMQMVFQDPYASLNPRRRVAEIVAEPLRVHRAASGRDARRRVDEALERVGLSSRYRPRYPHELSGGERQRVGIARALVLRPSLVVADEPVSALDVSIQAEVLELLAELRDELGLAYLFVAHDLGVVRQVADRIAVMRGGEIVELGPAETVCSSPAHPYTQELLAAARSSAIPRRH